MSLTFSKGIGPQVHTVHRKDRGACFSLFFNKRMHILLLVLWLCTSAYAQTPSAASSSALEVGLYRVLFRQTLEYERLANEADAQGSPRPYLRHVVQNRLDLSDSDTATLLRVAQGYEAELVPLRQAIAQEKTSAKAAVPLGLRMPGSAPRSSNNLDALHLQEDVLVLRHRDLLKNALTPVSFQHFAAQLYISAGQPLQNAQ